MHVRHDLVDASSSSTFFIPMIVKEAWIKELTYFEEFDYFNSYICTII